MEKIVELDWLPTANFNWPWTNRIHFSVDAKRYNGKAFPKENQIKLIVENLKKKKNSESLLKMYRRVFMGKWQHVIVNNGEYRDE